MSIFPETIKYLKKLLTFTKDTKQQYADVIIVNPKGEFLILLRSRIDEVGEGQWCLPGGHVDKGEEIDVAAIREVEEETGITLDPTSVEFIKRIETDDAKLNYYIASYSGVEHVYLDNDEHVNYEWISPSEIANRSFIFDLKNTLLDIFSVPTESTMEIVAKSQASSLESFSVKSKLEFANNLLNDALEGEKISIDRYMSLREKWLRLQKAEEDSLQEQTTDNKKWHLKVRQELSNANDFETKIDEQVKKHYDVAFKIDDWYYDKDGTRIPLSTEEILNIVDNVREIPVEHLTRLLEPDSILSETDRGELAKVWKRISAYRDLYPQLEDSLSRKQLDQLADWQYYQESINTMIDATLNVPTNVTKDQILSLTEMLKSQFKETFDPELLVKFNHLEPLEKYVYLSEFQTWLNEINYQEYLITDIKIVDLDLFREQQFNVEYLDKNDPDFVTQVHREVYNRIDNGNI